MSVYMENFNPAIAAAVVTVAAAVSNAMINTSFRIRRYTLASPKILPGTEITVAHLSDLHGKSFGAENDRLAGAVISERPHCAVMTGDMADWKRSDAELLLALVKKLGAAGIPVFCVMGNHEIVLAAVRYEQLKRALKNLGAIVLDSEGAVIPGTGGAAAVYGIELPYETYRKAGRGRPLKYSELERLPEADRSKFNILLVHNPVYFGLYARWGADLTLAGHMHGGLWRLPFAGGILSPELRLFPKYDLGEYTSDEKTLREVRRGKRTMIVSGGLGGLGRLFNPPEFSVIKIRPQSSITATAN